LHKRAPAPVYTVGGLGELIFTSPDIPLSWERSRLSDDDDTLPKVGVAESTWMWMDVSGRDLGDLSRRENKGSIVRIARGIVNLIL